MKELNLEEKKKIAFDILCKIDEVCRKNSITYYLAYGSLIGAVRHQGFIPWDDDIDIWVNYRDYQRFCVVMEQETNYEILNYEHDSSFPLMFTKISDRNTRVEKINKKNGDYRRGIAVDVFPLIYCPDKNGLKWPAFMINVIKALTRNDSAALHNPFQKIGCRALNLIGLDKSFWQKKVYKYFDGIKKMDYLFMPFSEYKLKDVHLAKQFDSTIELQFNDRFFIAPVGYDEILRDIYGDYMELPPEEKRISKHGTVAYLLK